MDFQSVIMLVVGFSAVIMIHEAGHFLAAKAVGISVGRFALGLFQPVLSWRKGLGFRVWSSEPEYLKLKEGGKADGVSETEYAICWAPFGGYVTMLGQDDAKPGMVVDDPRSYTNKTVGQRMLVISAGVIMNILFAGVAFMVLFMIGLKVPQAVVGRIIPMSPAQFAVTAEGTPAPLQVGDKIISINGVPQHNDFRKIALNTALAQSGSAMHVVVERVDGKVQTVLITPQRLDNGSLSFMGIGIAPPRVLEGPDLRLPALREQYNELPPEVRALKEGDRITQVAGQDVKADEYYKFDRAIQLAAGGPVDLTIVDKDGVTRHASVTPEISSPATKDELNFAGMVPRTRISSVYQKSPVKDKINPGDVVLAVASAGDVLHDPAHKEFVDQVLQAGERGGKVDITVLKPDGQQVVVRDIVPSIRIEKGKGLGIGWDYDQANPVISTTLKDSPAQVIPRGSTLREVGGQAVKNWSDVLNAFRKAIAANPGKPVTVVATNPGTNAEVSYDLTLRPDDILLLNNLRYEPEIVLRDLSDSRTTKNPLEAAWWGVQETRDSILQVYLTLRRLVEGSVPVSGIMGPVGMFSVGTKVASQGPDYLLWFLAIISANLAVVNFLPIPVVDGGHFLFLTIEKIQGKPVSERVVSIASYIGLGLILSVFVLVTYQDIMRMLTIQ